VVSAPKHVLVTGGSRGLGFAIVRRLVAGGYLVTSISRTIGEDLQKLRTEVPERLFAYEYDVRNVGNGQHLMRKVETVGALYALVNNVGVANDDLLIRLSEAIIRETLEVNLVAAILLSRAVARRLMRARSGRIVSISSIASQHGGRGLTVYAATKAAIEGFSRSLALELGRRNVTSNVVAPGFIDTDMTRTLDPEQRMRMRARFAVPRGIRAEDIAEAVLFLLSDAAASITGTTIVVDGGSRF
jgi:3-oxoacyl-[acyl-carrier protein] reductase